jgi:hypothetical protein
MIIQHDVFYDILKRFAHCVDRSLKKEQVEELYDRLKFTDEKIFRDAVEQLIDDESKLTLPAIKRAIAMQGKKNGETVANSHFNGIGCPDCSIGLIHTKRIIDNLPYSFVYRCKCRSYDAPFLPIYNGDGIDEARIPAEPERDIPI